jgi:serine/threonine protein kinase/WD40 repeat protein/Leucine-rich repeat (LRR) protein
MDVAPRPTFASLAMNRTCPTVEQLQQLALGSLPEPPASQIEEHVLACPRCQEETARLNLRDTFVEHVRQAAGVAKGAAQLGAEDQSRVARLISELSDVRLSSAGTQAHDETMPAARPDSSAAENWLDELRQCWREAEQPDELGRLGGYRVQKLLGYGGMGAVFLAEDVQLRRPVALKVMRPSTARQAGAAERFLREARAAAAVKDDHIVTIYQVGQDCGVPFIAQELLEGETLEERLKRDARLSMAEAVEIARQVAQGLAAAHVRGLLHRDIKPANVFLVRSAECEMRNEESPLPLDSPSLRTPHSALRIVKLLDFGLARSVTEDAHLTQTGQVIGTPAYMAPEQAEGKHVDARADLFSLGVVLYRMLTGVSPFSRPNVTATLIAIVNETPPPACSIVAHVPPALSELVDRLLAKEPGKRPAAAGEVARLLARPECSSPCEVSETSPPSVRSAGKALAAGPRAPRAARSRRVAIGLALAGLAAVLAGLVLTLKTPYGSLTVDIDEAAKDQVQLVVKQGGEIVEVADASSGWTLRLKEGQYDVALKGGSDEFDIDRHVVTVTRDGQPRVRVSFKPAAAGLSDTVASNSPRPAHSGDRLATSSPLDALDPANISESERYDWQPKELVAVLGSHAWRHWGAVEGVAIHRDGTWIASAGLADGVRLWDAATGRELAHWPGSAGAFTPDGTALAIANGSEVTLLELPSLRLRGVIRLSHAFGSRASLSFSSDGKTLAIANALRSHPPAIQVVDVPSRKLRWTEVLKVTGHQLALSPEGQLFAACDDGLKAWDLQTGRTLEAPKTQRATGVAISADGALLAAATADGIELFNRADGSEKGRLLGNNTMRDVYGLCFSPDGKWLAAGGDFEGARVWDLTTGKLHASFSDHRSHVRCLAFFPDGRTIASGGRDAALRFWKIETAEPVNRIPNLPFLDWLIALTPDGRTLVKGGGSDQASSLVLWDVLAGKPLADWDTTKTVLGLALANDGKLLATAGYDGVRLWELPAGRERRLVDEEYNPRTHANAITLSPDGKRLTSLVSTPAGLRVPSWDLQTRARVDVLPYSATRTPAAESEGLQYSADGSLLLIRNARRLDVWDVSTGKQRFSLSAASRFRNAQFSPDGSRLLAIETTDGGRPLCVFNTSDGSLIAEYRGQHDSTGVASAIFLADGEIVSAGVYGKIVRWRSPADRQTLFQLPGEVRAMVLAADGRHLFTSNGNGTVYVLRLAPAAGNVQPMIEKDPDRRAAQWVLSIGGTLTIPIGGEDRVMNAAGDLPAGNFWVRTVDLGANPNLNDDAMAQLANFTNLKTLYMSRTKVGDAGLAHLASRTTLTHLNLGQTLVGDAGMKHLEGNKNLVHLHLYGTHVGDAGLEHLNGLTSLTHLDLSGTRVTDSGLRHLRNCTQLANFYLGGTAVTDAAVPYLKMLTNLSKLDVRGTSVTASGVAELKKSLPNCEILFGSTPSSVPGSAAVDPDRRAAQWALSLGGTVAVAVNGGSIRTIRAAADLPAEKFQVTEIHLGDAQQATDAGLANVAGLRGLYSLTLQGPGITDAGLVHLKSIPTLQNLALSRTGISDAGLAHLAGLTNMLGLYLNNTPIGDGGLAHLAKLNKLATLTLGNTKVTDAGLPHLAGSTQLTALALNGTNVSDAGLEHLAGFGKLTDLNLYQTNVTDRGLDHLKKLASLAQLNLMKTRVSRSGAAELNKALPQCQIQFGPASPLEVAQWALACGGRVYVQEPKKASVVVAAEKDLPAGPFVVVRVLLADCGGKVTDASLAKLEGMTQLTHLDLNGTDVSDVGLNHLAGHAQLVALNLARTRITNGGLPKLTGLQNLDILYVYKTQASDAGLAHLAGLARLTSLDLGATRVTDAGLAHLQKLPMLAELQLNTPGVTNAGLPAISGLSGLKTLTLGGPQITDAGLEQLKPLTRLSALRLQRTSVTPEGIEKFKQVLPGCQVAVER